MKNEYVQRRLVTSNHEDEPPRRVEDHTIHISPVELCHGPALVCGRRAFVAEAAAGASIAGDLRESEQSHGQSMTIDMPTFCRGWLMSLFGDSFHITKTNICWRVLPNSWVMFNRDIYQPLFRGEAAGVNPGLDKTSSWWTSPPFGVWKWQLPIQVDRLPSGKHASSIKKLWKMAYLQLIYPSKMVIIHSDVMLVCQRVSILGWQ